MPRWMLSVWLCARQRVAAATPPRSHPGSLFRPRGCEVRRQRVQCSAWAVLYEKRLRFGNLCQGVTQEQAPNKGPPPPNSRCATAGVVMSSDVSVTGLSGLGGGVGWGGVGWGGMGWGCLLVPRTTAPAQRPLNRSAGNQPTIAAEQQQQMGATRTHEMSRNRRRLGGLRATVGRSVVQRDPSHAKAPSPSSYALLSTALRPGRWRSGGTQARVDGNGSPVWRADGHATHGLNGLGVDRICTIVSLCPQFQCCEHCVCRRRWPGLWRHCPPAPAAAR